MIFLIQMNYKRIGVRMRSTLNLLLLTIFTLSLLSCSANRFVNPREAEPQASVKLTMKDGSVKQGIVFKGNKEQLLFMNAATHKTDTVAYDAIQSVERLNTYYDFFGYEMPKAEISSHQGLSKTLLYGGGGLILGAAASTGLAIALFKPKEEGDAGNSGAAITTIVAGSVLGAAVFGLQGRKADFKDAVFATRKARYTKVHAELEKKKKELEKLKREQKAQSRQNHSK